MPLPHVPACIKNSCWKDDLILALYSKKIKGGGSEVTVNMASQTLTFTTTPFYLRCSPRLYCVTFTV